MDSQDFETKKENEMVVTLPSLTPVVGCQIIPDVRLTFKGPSVPRHSVSFNWYREVVSLGEVCSMHPLKVATVKCVECGLLKIPDCLSYHCSPKCFSDAWRMHAERHREVGGRLVVEREAKVWLKVASSQTYHPSIDDIGLTLMVECVTVDHAKGPELASVKSIITNPVIPFPVRRPRHMIETGGYQKSSNINFKSQSSDGLTFRVLSYNILADMYAGGGKYSHCPDWALLWEYRKQNLLQEIIEYDADILCLQEVQSDHFESFFKPELTKCGYSVMYKKKRTEGCATFFRNSLFKEIEEYELDFDRRAKSVLENLKREIKHKGATPLMEDNVIVILAVRDGSDSRICVVNTRIHGSLDLPDVKLFQVANLALGLKKITQSNIPLLICGDFSSTPESDAPMLLVRHTVEFPPLARSRIRNLEHSMVLASAYASFFQSTGIEEQQLKRMNVDPKTHEPLFTTFTPGFFGTLDYILYSAESLSVEGLLELLDKESLEGGLPTGLWSSDHIALMASFRFKSLQE